jgi:DeoR/GlpR family transcriptional regulator of sugar metabolism
MYDTRVLPLKKLLGKRQAAERGHQAICVADEKKHITDATPTGCTFDKYNDWINSEDASEEFADFKQWQTRPSAKYPFPSNHPTADIDY